MCHWLKLILFLFILSISCEAFPDAIAIIPKVSNTDVLFQPQAEVWNQWYTVLRPIDFQLISIKSTTLSSVYYYSAPEMDSYVTYFQEGENCKISCHFNYKTDVSLNKLYLSCASSGPIRFIQGPEAVSTDDPLLSKQSTPFSCKILQFQISSNKYWIVASHYRDVCGIERLDKDKIYLYDNTVHAAYMYMHGRDYDWYPRSPENHDDCTFLLFQHKPFMPWINYYPAGKRAAISITNDADCETERTLQAVYFGTSDTLSSDYGRYGLVANHIKVSNTVFGVDFQLEHQLWDKLVHYGNKIGYHTYQSTADDMTVLQHSLSTEMKPYNLKLWIDHNLTYNPEDIGNHGQEANSPLYILGLLQDNGFTYTWMGQNESRINNAFEDYGQLPHKIPYFHNCNLLFFKRRNLTEWEHPNPDISFGEIVTNEAISELLREKGLLIVYTHFSLTYTDVSRGYLLGNTPNSSEVTIKPEVDSRFAMLDYYQKYHGLWIDTIENVFDRFLATDSLQISNVTYVNNMVYFKLTNRSSFAIEDLELVLPSGLLIVPQIEPGASKILSMSWSNSHDDGITSDLNSLNIVQQTSTNTRIEFEFNIPIDEIISNIKIFNIKGQQITDLNLSISDKKVSFGMFGKSSGVYIMRVKDSHNQSKIFKFAYVK